MTEEEAKAEVEAKLRKQQMTKPMTEKEMTTFCVAMVRHLEMTSSTALVDVRAWTANWQRKWLRSG